MGIRRWLGSSSLVLVCASCSLACGDDDENGGSGTDTASTDSPGQAVSEAEFQSRLSDVACSALRTCCEEQGFSFNASSCQNFTSGAVSSNDGATYDAQAAGDCLKGLQNSELVCEEGLEISACDRVYSGAKAPGEACSEDSECAAPEGDGQAECDGFDEVCKITRRGQSGDMCSHSCRTLGMGGWACSGSFESTLPEHEEVQCFREDGLSCVDGVCTELLSEGQPCFSDDECTNENYCAMDATGERLCAARTAIGEACEQPSECVENAFCNGSGMCQALKSEGGACREDEECVGGSCDAGECGPDNPFGELANVFLGFVCAGGQL